MNIAPVSFSLLGINLTLIQDATTQVEFVDLTEGEYSLGVDGQARATIWKHDISLRTRLTTPYYFTVDGKYALLNKTVKAGNSLELPSQTVIAVQDKDKISIHTNELIRALMNPNLTQQEWPRFSAVLERYCIAHSATPEAQAWKAWNNKRIERDRLPVVVQGILFRIMELSGRKYRFVS